MWLRVLNQITIKKFNIVEITAINIMVSLLGTRSYTFLWHRNSCRQMSLRGPQTEKNARAEAHVLIVLTVHLHKGNYLDLLKWIWANKTFGFFVAWGEQ